jgi:hypothetical protein
MTDRPLTICWATSAAGGSRSVTGHPTTTRVVSTIQKRCQGQHLTDTKPQERSYLHAKLHRHRDLVGRFSDKNEHFRAVAIPCNKDSANDPYQHSSRSHSNPTTSWRVHDLTRAAQRLGRHSQMGIKKGLAKTRASFASASHGIRRADQNTRVCNANKYYAMANILAFATKQQIGANGTTVRSNFRQTLTSST